MNAWAQWLPWLLRELLQCVEWAVAVLAEFGRAVWMAKRGMGGFNLNVVEKSFPKCSEIFKRMRLWPS
jgi:hypothetical protein